MRNLRHIIHGEARDGGRISVRSVNLVAGEIHYDVLPESIARVAPPTNLTYRTLSPEEVADAAPAVDLSALVRRYSGRPVATYARKDGVWYWTTSRTAIASGLFDEVHDVHVADPAMAAALERVLEHWRVEAERDSAC
jgi:hypothetical protein